ncbi:hypothetical protein BCY91_04945 [Pelobium manganitolerans]|uniref:Uncharacterized protein n=1 Tax=Pelobium manganitolerans TaxID=1842495 RepID=A0A419S5W0_9SPHI|nr:hypothetical protein [Pelobium manganitolerans]RKD16224.1 hypothetical protein BCY91_04945 [Pelobium manganitolerans]
MSHTFHIPVLGLGYTVDTPIKVAPYGISSVASIVDDIAIERIRANYCKKTGRVYEEISDKAEDSRARRITAYLNLMQDLVDEEFERIKNSDFATNSKLNIYFELLPADSPLRKQYETLAATTDLPEKEKLTAALKKQLVKGKIDVNIMAKVDKMNVNEKGELREEIYSDALASLRGFAQSKLQSSVVLSAGMNPRLYAYLDNFADFLPDSEAKLKKKIILKVSDFRSAFIQAKFLAKRGIWISEFRIESGLNCGGHAFATEGFLLGPILEEFKQKKNEMIAELFDLYQKALVAKEIEIVAAPSMKISVQGGIGTASENEFLMQYYQLDATGWGSPFLMVPEVTAVDLDTLNDLAEAEEEDFYVSGASPLGIPFNNFKKSGAEKQRLQRIADGRPGSPCTKKFLVSNTEFTSEPICTASRKYQNLKIKELQKQGLNEAEYQQKFDAITEKLCLCEGLVNSYYIKEDILKPKENKAVAICPGPNLAFFKGPYKLEQMVNHIYGRINLLEGVKRPHMFINELKLYVEYLRKDIETNFKEMNAKKEKSINNFIAQLQNGIGYYKNLASDFLNLNAPSKNDFFEHLREFEAKIVEIKNGMLATA